MGLEECIDLVVAANLTTLGPLLFLLPLRSSPSLPPVPLLGAVSATHRVVCRVCEKLG